jgi:type II secretory pathway pseudopilin PulG
MTVMSIIILLIGLLVPALNMVKRYAKRVMQKNQFHTIEVAMDIFNAEWEEYPPSEAKDEENLDYCGAMKLAEAMVGQDLAGYNPASKFRRDGQVTNDPATVLYFDPSADRSARRLYLKPENANANPLEHLFPAGVSLGGFLKERLVLCDVYGRVTHTVNGKLVGMPILYYRADATKTQHDATPLNNPQNIYDFRDNFVFAQLQPPWDPQGQERHPLAATPKLFYQKTVNPNITMLEGNRPYRADSYILLSAGFDGLYGTDDDVFNFGK